MADAAKIIMTEGDAPATPAAGTVVIYAKADRKFYYKDDAGAESGLAGAAGPGAWVEVGQSDYTATPASTSTITMDTDQTAVILKGYALKYTIAATTYYGIVSAIAANLLTVAGAPMGGDVTNLYYMTGSTNVTQIAIIIPGLYEDATNTDLITSDLASNFIWNKTKAYLVRYRVYSAVHDSAAHGQASVQINNTEVNTTAGGLTIAANTTWYSTVVDIAVAAYDVNPGEEIEVTCIKGGTGDASDLTVEMTFVIP